ncbi:type II secretion system protein GspM [Cloacibacillus porcorum]|uniref:type II secretion system protein GspM n=1 Tax=Cloacibacillus porcorum TaxID=1197717 RepID=UPI002671FBEF|nr:type II secretion system protein GspM [Cloacibacillus porcorum]
MLSLEELRAMPGAKRLQRVALITVMIWLAALLVFSAALSAMSENEDRLSDAEKILNAAITVKAYPQQGAVSGKEPLSAVSEIIDKLGLQSKVNQLSSSPSGLVLQINRLYHEELGKLVEDIQRNGLSVKTAELRSLTGQKDGRLINVTLTIVGEDQ